MRLVWFFLFFLLPPFCFLSSYLFFQKLEDKKFPLHFFFSFFTFSFPYDEKEKKEVGLFRQIFDERKKKVYEVLYEKERKKKLQKKKKYSEREENERERNGGRKRRK